MEIVQQTRFGELIRPWVANPEGYDGAAKSFDSAPTGIGRRPGSKAACS